jgi:uracil-DNA glycosylase
MQIFKNDWDIVLKTTLEGQFFKNVGEALAEEREKGVIIYPDKTDYFKAFKTTPYHKVRVVILGQDPYANGESDGLAFSVKNDSNIIKQPAANKAILEEVEKDVYSGFKVEQDWNLERWAVQGVLLLNVLLSVQKGKPKSHYGIGWTWIIGEVIEALDRHPNPICFMLWGKLAKDYKTMIKNPKHLVLTSGHPTTKYYEEDLWSDNKHFSTCNKFLRENNEEGIEW